MKAPVD